MRNQLRLLRDVSALILIACTWRLWFAASGFPAVPFFGFLTTVPRSVDPILAGLLVTSLLSDAGIAVVGIGQRHASMRLVRAERICDSVFALSAGMLILLNQHCLQPWMYHFLVLTPLLWMHTSRPDANAESELAGDDSRPEGSSSNFSRQTIVCLTASIYAWSAWSKLDMSFLHSHGPKFVGVICDAVGVSTRFWADRIWLTAAATLPIGELLVGVALLFHRTRPAGLVVSLVMHLLLIVAVGPWGLNHQAGVLLWNGFFIAQNVILLLTERRSRDTAGLPGSGHEMGPRAVGQAGSRVQHRAAWLIIVGAILFPAFRSLGYCDTWPAWAVYASSPARVLVQVRNDSVEQLPESLQQYVEPRRINDGWSWLRIDLWSLNATGTPIYPEDRFQLAVARSVSRDFDLRNGIRIIHEGESDRWSEKRDRIEAIGESEIEEFGMRFRLNSAPR